MDQIDKIRSFKKETEEVMTIHSKTLSELRNDVLKRMSQEEGKEIW